MHPGGAGRRHRSQSSERVATDAGRGHSVTVPPDGPRPRLMWARVGGSRQACFEPPLFISRPNTRYERWVLFTKPNSSQDTIHAFSTATSPTDTVTANWSAIQSIRNLVPLSEATAYTFWHGTEYLKLAGSGPGSEFLAGFNDSDQSITYTQMQSTSPPTFFAGGCPSALEVEGGRDRPLQFEIRLAPGSGSRRRLALEISLPQPEADSRTSVRIAFLK